MENNMNSVLWVFQILVALVFLATGIPKVMLTKEKLERRMDWVKEAPVSTVKIVGVLEILGAVGLIFPALSGILPWLTPLAAVGLTLTMIGASVTHIRQAEYSKLWLPISLLVLAVFIAYGRFVVAPI
jgi:uncharacterized membrane protein YphA (DoxX/SURF4 family)